MASTIKVDKLDPQSGTALEIGTSGDTVTVPSGVGLTLTDSTLLLPTTITSTTEVKTNKISPATGTAFALGDSGDTFTVPSGATIVNSGTATGFGGGKVGQVVQTVITTAQALSTSTSKIDLPGYTVAITPVATSSKILVEWYIMFGNDSGDRHLLYLNRGTTEIGIGTTAGLGELCTTGLMTANSNNYWAFNATGSFLDSPSTTSATTYKFQINSGSSYTCHFNRTARGSADGCYISTMTATEVLA